MTLQKITLQTETFGDFTFEKHHNSAADPYQAMLNFESNNWERLGECSYTIVVLIDGVQQSVEFTGMNADTKLAYYIADEENPIHSQYNNR